MHSESGQNVHDIAGGEGSGGQEAMFDIAGLTDLGNERENNEDYFGTHQSEDEAIFIVADGVGGYEGGEIASRTAVETTIETYLQSPPSWGRGKRLHRAVQQANIDIYDRAIVVPELRQMATTATAGVVEDGTLYAAHVGDSRLYLVRAGRTTQLTKDHTLSKKPVRMGRAPAPNPGSESHVLTRSVGRELIVAIDQITAPIQTGDRIIVGSDGLYTMFDDEELGQLTEGLDAAHACARLVEEANHRGASDNVTALVVCVRGIMRRGPEHIGSVRARLRRMLGRGT